ncbi:MAG: homoserine dehydrogenase [Oscillospiraceae bacterium]|nr:homoserine dehydrogenase [Oscillospiraceae bacterium]
MVKVAILGFGTVGSGVAEVLTMNADRIARNTGREISIKYIVDVRDFPGNPFEKYLVKDFALVENDPEVSVVVETIGGVGVAYDFSRRVLQAGKSLVTSNKELVATHGYELMSLAKEKGVNYLFEASVGGGIPVLRPICQCLAANSVQEIYGILNGTTNYILTEMIQNGVPFEDALAGAQARGYAERNPAADIEGHDACRKICILSTLCFGKHVYPDNVPAEGITSVTLDDVRNAELIGCKIKLLGRAVLTPEGKPAAYVAPHLVRSEKLISGVSGVMNAIVVEGNAVGEVMFYGAGAGKLPTASAVVADVIDAAKHENARKQISWEDGDKDTVADPDALVSRWYVRTKGDVPFEKIAEGAYLTDAMDKAALMEKLGEAGADAAFRVLE